MMWKLVLLCAAVAAVAASEVDKSNGFNSKIDWITPSDLSVWLIVFLSYFFLQFIGPHKRLRQFMVRF